MKDKPAGPPKVAQDNLFHLPKERGVKSSKERMLREMELSLASHFREQNELLQANNRELSDKLQLLTNSVERLVHEMDGVRTGRSEEAFAESVAASATPDLPTVSAEAALFYIYTAGQIGGQLGFHCSQIGLLLGPKGLKWAGEGTYQEIGRTTNPSHSKFWHKEVPERLRRILNEGDPEKYEIKTKAVLPSLGSKGGRLTLRFWKHLR